MDFYSLPPWLGTLPGWFTSAGVMGCLSLMLKYSIDARKARVDEHKDDRDNYAVLIKALQEDCKAMRDRVKEVEISALAQTKLCQDENAELREKIDRLHDEIYSLRRTIRQGEMSAIRTLPPNALSPEITAALDKLDKIG